MCKKTEFKSIDKMTRQEQEAIYQRALGLTMHRWACIEYHATTIKHTAKCSYCGLVVIFTGHSKHENTCILSKISIEEFISEYTNPTMPRKEFLKKYNQRVMYTTLVCRLISLGLIPSDIKEGNIYKLNYFNAKNIGPNKCKHCGITSGYRFHATHEKTCMFIKVSLDKFMSDYNNPTISHRQLVKNYGLSRGRLSWWTSKFKEAGRLP